MGYIKHCWLAKCYFLDKKLIIFMKYQFFYLFLHFVVEGDYLTGGKI